MKLPLLAAFLLLLAATAFTAAARAAPPTCSDGTPYGACSATKPKFCEGGVLMSQCVRCGCSAALICDSGSGECLHPVKPITVSILRPAEMETIQSAKDIRLIGVAGNMPNGSALEIDDSRFFLRTINLANGSFEFANRTALPDGSITVKITLRDGAGRFLASETRSFVLAARGEGGAVSQATFFRWELIALALLLGVLALALLEYGRHALFAGRALPRLSLMRGDVVLVEGPVGSRKEEFCLSHLGEELRKGNSCAVISYQPEKEAAWFSEPERNKLTLVKAEPEINSMALAVSGLLEKGPGMVYLNILHGLSPKYGARDLSAFLESTIKKLKAKGVTGIFVAEKETLSPQVLSTLESLFDGVSEFEVRAIPSMRVFYRVKEFKLREFSPDWVEYA